MKMKFILLDTPPSPLYRSNFDSTPPPILIDAGVAVLENEKIERLVS